MEALGGVSVRCYGVSGGGGGVPERFDVQSSKNMGASAAASYSSVGFKRAPCHRRSPGLAPGIRRDDYFRERDHLDYYSSGGERGRGRMMIWCGKGGCEVVDKEKKKNKNKEKEAKEKTKMMKKRLKKMLQAQMQGDDLSISSEAADADPLSPFPDQVKVAKMISDAAEVLLEQLQQLHVEEKDLETSSRDDCQMMSSESSSSSESSDSDSECGEVVTDMRALKSSCNPLVVEPGEPMEAAEAIPTGVLVEDVIENNNFQPPTSAAEAALVSCSYLENEITAATYMLKLSSLAFNSEQQSQFISGTSLMNSPVVAATTRVLSPSTKKVEVCMGGKCKKAGSIALLGEFQRRLGSECAAVSGCKCMGRCREGPNVRISNESISNSLCIGVGLADVDAILENYLAQSPEFGLNAA